MSYLQKLAKVVESLEQKGQQLKPFNIVTEYKKLHGERLTSVQQFELQKNLRVIK